jgi:hypothetical protein
MQQQYDQLVQRERQTDPVVIAKVYTAEELRELLKVIDKTMVFPDERTLTGAKKPLVAQMAQRLSEHRKTAK